ncbi:septum formation initiator family protein [Candidatus Kaiserbacteria bacterium]|nr:septum formation initiator family protein [Candidatus Kaiserbacteria bacterium]MCB9812119.1 septum formation initiator family protein [Candidatus Nomurabacteria bacterium]
MLDFHQKRKLRSVINSPITQGAIALLALIVGWSAYVRYDIAMEMRERRVEAEQAAMALEARKAALEAKVEYLSSERGIEAEMRRQFDVALPGEQVVVIVEEENDEPEVLPLSSSTTPKGSSKKWYQFWR